jgi:lysozyme inhibitor LprI
MSSPRYLWIFAAYFLSTSTFAALQLTPADRAAITQCIGRLHDNNDYGETTCAGIIPNPCIKSTDAAACAARELRVWDERLQISLKIAKASFPALQPAIADAQSIWLKSREEVCPKLSIEGTNDRSDYCRLQETSRRA